MLVIGIIVVVIVLVAAGIALFLRAERRSISQRDDVDIDSLLANLDRLAALESTGLMDAPVRPDLDALTREAATSLRAPMAFMTLVDSQRQFFASQYGRDAGLPRETGLEYSFCKHVVAGEVPFQVTDAARDRRVQDNLGTTEGGVRSYLGVPLRMPSGEVIGSFCVVDTAARVWEPAAQARLEKMATKAMKVAMSAGPPTES